MITPAPKKCKPRVTPLMLSVFMSTPIYFEPSPYYKIDRLALNATSTIFTKSPVSVFPEIPNTLVTSDHQDAMVLPAYLSIQWPYRQLVSGDGSDSLDIFRVLTLKRMQ